MAASLRLALRVSLAFAGAWLALLVVSDEAEASHFRQMDVRWSEVSSSPLASTVDLYGTTYWRIGSNACSGSICGPVGDVDWGDGSATSPVYYTLDATSVAEGWEGGTLVDATGSVLQHAYAAFGGPYFADVSSCCRIGTTALYDHVNNGNAAWEVDFVVDLADASSPTISMPNGIHCVINTVCTFPVTASGGSPTTWSLAGPLVQPGPPDATFAATIGAGTGTYSWNTWGATFNAAVCETVYSTQVHVDQGGASATKSAVDFLIRLHDNTLPSAPTLTATPINGILPGAQLSWTQPPGVCPGLYYRIYRSFTSDFLLPFYVEIPGPATSWTDPLALPCITTYYRVGAVNWAGETLSNIASSTPSLGGPCPIPPPVLCPTCLIAVETLPPGTGWLGAPADDAFAPAREPGLEAACAPSREPFDTRAWLPFLDGADGCAAGSRL